MTMLRALLLSLGLLLGFTSLASAQNDVLGNTLYLDFKDGRVTILLSPNVAPKTVAHIKDLVRKGFYDGTPVHRVIPGFMAQMGDPTGTGTGGSGRTVPAEFSQLPFDRGTVGMARQPDNPNSGDSQFFICFGSQPSLNGQYTVFGQVTAGMDVVDKIKVGDESNNGVVDHPDKLMKATLGDMK